MSTSGTSSLIDASIDLWDHVKNLFINFAKFLRKTIEDLIDEVIKRLGEVFKEACNLVLKLVEEGAEYFKKIFGNEEHSVKEKVVVNMGKVLNCCQDMVLEELNRIKIEQGKPPVDWKNKSMKEIEEALKEMDESLKSSKPSTPHIITLKVSSSKPSTLAALPGSGGPHFISSNPSMLAALPAPGGPHITNLAVRQNSIDKDFVELAMSIFEGLIQVRSIGVPLVS